MNPDHEAATGMVPPRELVGSRPRSARGRNWVAAVDASGFPQLVARLVVGGMFGYLAILKLRDPLLFLKLTRDYAILPLDPPLWLNLTALFVPYVELICAAALILGLWRRGAALVITLLLAAFTPLLLVRAVGLYQAAAAQAAGSGYSWFCAVKFDCGCGTGEVYICSKVAENTGLLLGALLVLLSRSRWLSLDAVLRRRPNFETPDRRNVETPKRLDVEASRR